MNKTKKLEREYDELRTHFKSDKEFEDAMERSHEKVMKGISCPHCLHIRHAIDSDSYVFRCCFCGIYRGKHSANLHGPYREND